eukprot:CAMPEP_0204899422 /NCGR_PEP_ID=MMETSP1397-20131031/1840_1 /ASSEMBLY_ACC=CAM_ASM_000891 /TAXON_ID=49980 /ORGANISM="Climacostomum Climacostomum virens, Strain Stock W-24" /LENGTH=675 /DNA_ID=CAMNT_0052067381 /DNA_START=1039 /DNA_END=3062 /DNA_ORIENTATION=+
MSTWRYTGRTNGKVKLCSLSFRQLTTSTFNSANFESAKVVSFSEDAIEPRKKSLKTFRKDLEVYTWGSGQEGALGHGTFEDLPIPKAVVRLKDIPVKEIVCGAGHSLILTEDSRVYAWGFNKVGQLGQGDFVDRAIPVEVDLPKDVLHIRSGAGHCFALTKGGRVYSWGFSEYYQTGLNTQENQNSPVLMRSLRNISDIACGITHTLLLTFDGRVLSVGYNSQGQCGVGKLTQFCTHPETISFNASIKKVAAGGAHSLFLTNLGIVYACGLNANGQCSGTAQMLLSPEPVKISTNAHFVTEGEGCLEGVTTIAAGEETSAALTTSGELLVWGWNGCGQLAQGHFTNLLSPTKVPIDEAVTSVSCGVCLVAFVTESGRLYKAGWEGERNAFMKSPRVALSARVFDDSHTVKLVCCGRTHIVAAALKSNVLPPQSLATKEVNSSFELDGDTPKFNCKSNWKNRLYADKEPEKMMPILSIVSSQSHGNLPARKAEFEPEHRYLRTLQEVPVSRGARQRTAKYKILLEQSRGDNPRGDNLKSSESSMPNVNRPSRKADRVERGEFVDSIEDDHEVYEEAPVDHEETNKQTFREAKSKSMPPIEPRKKSKAYESPKHDPLIQFFDRELNERRRPPSGKFNDFEIVKAKIAIIDRRIQAKQRTSLTKSGRKEQFVSPTKRT